MNRFRIFIPVALVAVVMTAAQTKPVPKATMEAGKKVYESYCLACHQQDGAGVPRLNPPLAKTSYVTGDKKRLIGIILKGMDEQVEIEGNYYSNVMPAQDFLNDQEIANVLTYIRNSFGNKASVVSAAEVKTERARLKKK